MYNSWEKRRSLRKITCYIFYVDTVSGYVTIVQQELLIDQANKIRFKLEPHMAYLKYTALYAA